MLWFKIVCGWFYCVEVVGWFRPNCLRDFRCGLRMGCVIVWFAFW